MIKNFPWFITGNITTRYVKGLTLRHCVFKDATELYQTAGNLEIPVLLIYGPEDSFITEESLNRIGELIPISKFSEILGSGHLAVIEKPEEVSRILINFISLASR